MYAGALKFPGQHQQLQILALSLLALTALSRGTFSFLSFLNGRNLPTLACSLSCAVLLGFSYFTSPRFSSKHHCRFRRLLHSGRYKFCKPMYPKLKWQLSRDAVSVLLSGLFNVDESCAGRLGLLFFKKRNSGSKSIHKDDIEETARLL